MVKLSCQSSFALEFTSRAADVLCKTCLVLIPDLRRSHIWVIFSPQKKSFYWKLVGWTVEEMGGEDFPVQTQAYIPLTCLVFFPLKKRGADRVSKKGWRKRRRGTERESEMTRRGKARQEETRTRFEDFWFPRASQGKVGLILIFRIWDVWECLANF